MPLAVLLCLAGGIGCGVRKPIEVDPQFGTAGVDKIVVLPVIDARSDRLDYVALGRNVGDATSRMLHQKKYRISQSDSYAQHPAGRIDIDSVTAGEVVALVPEDVRYFLVVQVERMDRSIDESGVYYTVWLSGLLVDRERGRVLWRDVASASSHLTGMLTLISRGSSQYEAAVNASRALLETFPPRQGSDKNNRLATTLPRG